MEDDAMLLMQTAHEVAHLPTENALHGSFFRRDHVHFDVACAQRRCDFETDEARAKHDCAPSRLGALDDSL